MKVIDNLDPRLTDRQIVLWQSGEDQGEEFVEPALRDRPSCDFGEDSAIELALRYVAARRKGGPNTPIRVGFIGLGVGMTLSYAKPGDVVRYYELNPAVAEAAREHFSFMKNTKATVAVVLGDGRLSLEGESKMPDFPKFDVLAMDAFRGAAPRCI